MIYARSTTRSNTASEVGSQVSQCDYLPMRWHIAEPLDAGGLEGDVGVEAASDGLVDGGLLLLGQQLDQSLLGADVALDAAVGVVEVADDGALLGEGRDTDIERAKATFGDGWICHTN